MRVPALVHWALARDLVLSSQIESSVFLWWTASTSNQNLIGRNSDGCGALIELASIAITQLLNLPFVFINIVAKADFRVDIITEQVNAWYLILRTLKLSDKTDGLVSAIRAD